jgi:uncharacterized Zn finger protein (UPF0148 family)
MADATEDLLRAGFVETVFHCPSCGLSGTSLSRPSMLLGRTCADCGDPVVTSVFERFPSRGRPSAR